MKTFITGDKYYYLDENMNCSMSHFRNRAKDYQRIQIYNIFMNREACISASNEFKSLLKQYNE